MLFSARSARGKTVATQDLTLGMKWDWGPVGALLTPLSNHFTASGGTGTLGKWFFEDP